MQACGLRMLASSLLALACFPAVSPGQENQAAKATTHMVAMSDGVKLATDVYLPEDGKGQYPVIVARTPYNKNLGGVAIAANAVKHGYAFVIQDLRGRFKSEGHHSIIFGNDGLGERQDGPDTLKWIAKQPWCNGKIGSWGPSALGITQNMAAPNAPDELKAQHVSVAFSDFYSQGAYQGGAFRTQLLERWLQATGMTEKNLDAFVAHPRYDDFWKQLNPETQASKVRAPAVFYGGWYDIFVQGTINSFMATHYRGGEGARGKCRLVLGPIGHGPITELKYPPSAAKLPACADAFNWFDHVLLGKDNAAAKEKAVHYYVMGDPTDPKAPGNVWRQADHWPPPARPTPFYLHADGALKKGKAPEGNESKTYAYDPKNPVPNIGGQELGVPLGPKDQRRAEERPDVLVFTTAELTEPIEVTGRLWAKLFVSSDCPDTDFTVKLSDVYPDGRSMLVTDGILRARYHRSFEKESFLEPGQVYELNVDLWSTSLVFNKGHRIRVAVSSSNSPRFEANPNTGKPFRADKETRIAKNTVHLSLKYPSRIVLPVHEAASSDGPAGKLRSLLDKARAQHDVPALSAGIIDGSQPKQVAVVGMRKRGADDLATEDDQWHLGSNTKPITALLIALLIELGLLDWDTPLEDIFPQHADKWSADLKSITPAHLLTHTSGLPANALYALLLAGNQESEVRQREIVLKSLAATKLAAEPGAKYQYSNLGYIVLGAIIDARGKASWEEQLEKKVLQPLGIMNWGLGPAGEKQPWPHQTRGKPVSPDGSRDNPPILNSAGRVRMSVGDYQRFLAETLKLSRGEQGLLKSATAKKLYTNPYPVSPHSLSGWISFRKPQDLKDLVFGHDGSNTFNYCTALVIPDRQLAFCVMTNQGGPGGPGASACHQVQKELRTSSAKPASP